MIKKNILIGCLTVICFTLNSSLFAQKKAKKEAVKDTNEWRYELECEGTGLKGTYIVKVWSYSKNKDVAIESAKRNAVHGVIFRGFQGRDDCKGQKALVRNINVEKEKEDFFSKFFADGGRYLKFVNLSTDGQISAADRYKIGKKEYKIGVIVSVAKDELRKDLEEAGIIKGLSNGF